ncbi:MAG: hypothetical protein COA79_17885 [Planctomycetota bacterium]|nr:MAG: hypothetical protein COA79_17885 [Planctomycetota bacterium]
MKSMDYAREAFVKSLFKPRTYRVGKVSGIGQAKSERETILDIKGRGVLKHIWTTHANKDRVKIYIFTDGRKEPLLSGFAHELALAAEKISNRHVPLGGYHDHGSVNLYIPIQFTVSLRIEAEPVDETGDGPYWQIDYMLDSEESWPLPQQVCENGKPKITYGFAPTPQQHSEKTATSFDEDFELTKASPHNIWLEGGGVIRRLVISGSDLDSLLLRIAFDCPRDSEDRIDGPFQVDAPLRYLVGEFNNACIERLGSKAIIHFPMPFNTRVGIQLLAAMDYGSFTEKYHFNIRIEYDDTPPPSESLSYFHAQFRCEKTNGYDDFECCAIRGKGHFVGVHIFDTGHDHGGGDNILFDAGADSAGQLHGICGEDYFHMAYMRIWNLTPFSGCPSHSARYRYHLDMPIPFEESFVFNWGSFASQPAKAVAFWYQEQPSSPVVSNDMIYKITGPFDLARIDDFAPGNPFPETAQGLPSHNIEKPLQSWRKTAQQGFVDLCHMHRRYIWPVPFSYGIILSEICTCAETKLWAAHSVDALIRLGCDDPIRLYLNDELIFTDNGRKQPDPFHLFKVKATLCEGLNTIRVVVANTKNFNWHWNGFSLVVEADLAEQDILFMI